MKRNNLLFQCFFSSDVCSITKKESQKYRKSETWLVFHQISRGPRKILNGQIKIETEFTKFFLEEEAAVNFINVLCKHFLYKILSPKITKPNIIREKVLNSLLYEKPACKMLMTLTHGCYIINLGMKGYNRSLPYFWS